MAKGSIRKKGKKWYYRFYVKDADGRSVQKEFVGTESRSETEAMLHKALKAYEEKDSPAVLESCTVGELLENWIREDLLPGELSNGTVSAYVDTVRRIKKDPLAIVRLNTVTTDHLQSFIDRLSRGEIHHGGTSPAPLSRSRMRQINAVLQAAFRFAVYPKRLIEFNPMQCVKLRRGKSKTDLFSAEGNDRRHPPIISGEQYKKLVKWLKKKHNPALLPIQIAYYSGLRVGETCGLTWQDVDLEEQYFTIRRSMRYNRTRHVMELGPTKSNKIRTVEFGDTLAAILKKARREMADGDPSYINCCRKVSEEGRTYYEIYRKPRAEQMDEECMTLDLICVRPNGAYISPGALEQLCCTIKKELPELGAFHFHMLRHTYTSNLLSLGARPTDVQELLGHASVNTTLSIYAHATRETKLNTVKLLDKVL